MVVCIADKHAVLAAIHVFAANFLGIICNANFAESMEGQEIQRVLFEKLSEGGFLAGFYGQIFHFCCGVGTHSAQRPWHNSSCFAMSLAKFTIDRTHPNSVANLRSTRPFCCRVWHAVNSKWSPRPSRFALA